MRFTISLNYFVQDLNIGENTLSPLEFVIFQNLIWIDRCNEVNNSKYTINVALFDILEI